MATSKDSSVLAGRIAVGGNVISSLLSSFANVFMNERNNNLQQRLAEQANQWSIDQWNRENAYNTPSAQMERIRAAGLNPSLAMTGGQLMNEAASSPQVQMANVRPGQVNFPVVDPLTMAQIANLNAQTDKVNAETKTEDVLRQARYDQLTTLTSNLAKQNDEIVARIQRYAKENELSDATIEKMRQDVFARMHELMNDDRRLSNETELTEAQVKNINADIKKKLAEKNVAEREYLEMIWTYALRKTKLANEIHGLIANTEVARATAKKLGIESEMERFAASTEGRKADLFDTGDFGITTMYVLQQVLSTLGSFLHISISPVK